MKHTNIAVLETRWWARSNVSVRGFFDLIADIHCDNPHTYHYEMVNSEQAAKEAITRIGSLRHCKYLYFASHGDEGGLHFEGEQRLTRTELRNALAASDGSQFIGLYLGACAFGARSLADHLFKNGDVKLKWVAGYSKDLDWVQSSVLDLLVLNEILGRRRKGDSTPQHLQRSMKKVNKLAGGLIKELGFGFYVPKGRRGGVKNLLDADEV